MTNTETSYDFIFLGAGCASLSIIIRMIKCGKFNEKKILIIDKEEKNKNDRTWCYWENETGYFESIVYQKWRNLKFKTEYEDIALDIAPYEYKMIRGIDFYNHCFSEIKKCPNISVIYGNISIKNAHNISVNDQKLDTKGSIIFNSIYDGDKEKKSHYLLQHFKGWIVETSKDIFSDATLMDFSIRQNNGTEFMYVLPFSPTKALIEYTLFSENILPDELYIKKLKKYIKKEITHESYSILESEFGVIPMTNMKFRNYHDGMFHIGTAGGQTKASTGYTFKYIQENSQAIVTQLIQKGIPEKRLYKKRRFHFYDSTLLNILAGKKLEGKKIFTDLFMKNKASQVFKFLDNETTLTEELFLINTLPKIPFIKAGLTEFVKMFK